MFHVPQLTSINQSEVGMESPLPGTEQVKYVCIVLSEACDQRPVTPIYPYPQPSSAQFNPGPSQPNPTAWVITVDVQ